MKVQSIKGFSPVSKAQSFHSNNKLNAMGGGLAASSNSITLADSNYNAAIKAQALAFKGNDLPVIVKTNPIESTLNAALGFVGTNDIVLVGQDIDTAREDLLKNVETLPKALNRVFFVEDKTAKSSFMVASNTHNINYVQNLGSYPMYQIADGEVYKLTQGNRMFPRDDGKFRSGRTGLPFQIKPDYNAPTEALQDKNLKIYDFQNLEQSQLYRLNKERISTLGKVQEADVKEIKKFTFSDVGGQDKAIKELKEAVVYPIKYPQAFKVMNHGIILEGGPGTGKTLLAEALANEVEANFIKLNGLEMESKWVGESEQNMRDLFEQAKAQQPCIVFIDEFDAIARKREGSDTSRHDDKMVNQLLTLMSDLEKQGDRVFVIAATNRKDVIDEAVARSGRFGKHINVPNPDLDGCDKIFDIHSKNRPISEEFNKDAFVEKLHKANVSGADIAAICENAKNKAFLREGIFEKMEEGTFVMDDLKNLQITEDDFLEALEDFKNENKDGEVKKKNPIGYIWNE